jgi:hypothetical protein
MRIRGVPRRAQCGASADRIGERVSGWMSVGAVRVRIVAVRPRVRGAKEGWWSGAD